MVYSARVTFGKKLRKWRGNRTQAAAAAELGIPVGTYQNYEYDHRKPHNGACRKCIEQKIKPTNRKKT